MTFEIEFNKREWENNDVLAKLGANLEVGGASYPTIEINSLEDLQRIEREVYKLTGEYFSLVVGFDSPTIFLDKDI